MPDRGQIRSKGDNKYLIGIYVGRVDGKKKYAWKSFEGTISQARQALTKMLREKDTDTFVAPSKLTLKQYLTDWLNGKADVEAKTILDYKHRMEKDVYPFIGGLQLTQLGPTHISVLYGKLRERAVKGTDKKLSPRTIQYTHAILKQALEHAVEDGLLQRNPCLRSSVKQALPAQKKTPPEVLTLEEIRKVILGETDAQRKVLWTVMLTTAMRPQEVLALKWEDLRDGAFHISRAIHEEAKGKEVIKPFTKTEGSTRSVMVPESVLQDLLTHKATQAAAILKAGQDYDRQGYVFAARTGAFLSRSNVRRWWTTALTRVGIAERKLYTTRHTLPSHLIAGGASPKDVAELLGHADPAMTLRTYTHSLPGAAQDLARRAGNLLLVKQA